MSRVVHTGSVIADLVLNIQKVPEPGGDIIASSSEVTAGGALNSIVASTRDGADVLFVGLYGTGPMGDVVTAGLAESGAEVLFDRVPDLDSGFTVALVDATAERTFITHLGAEDRWDVDQARSIPVQSGDVVYVSGYSLASARGVKATEALVGRLPQGAQLVVDPSPLVTELDPDAFTAVFARADIISANGREIRHLGGDPDLHTAARSLAAAWPTASIVARDGAQGCAVLVPAQELVHVSAPAVEAVDTSGAGDTHVGVMMAALSRGAALLDAARRANVAAAIQVTRLGPATAPTAEETDAALAAFGFPG